MQPWSAWTPPAPGACSIPDLRAPHLASPSRGFHLRQQFQVSQRRPRPRQAVSRQASCPAAVSSCASGRAWRTRITSPAVSVPARAVRSAHRTLTRPLAGRGGSRRARTAAQASGPPEFVGAAVPAFASGAAVVLMRPPRQPAPAGPRFRRPGPLRPARPEWTSVFPEWFVRSGPRPALSSSSRPNGHRGRCPDSRG